QARLQQEWLGGDDPRRVAEATHGHVEGFHRDNNVIPMSRKVSTRPAGATACLGSLLPARPRAQSLGGAHAALVIEPALARPRRGPARLARLGGDEGAADELDQALLRTAAGPLLRAVAARDDQDRALSGEPSTAHSATPCLSGIRSPRTA